MKKSRTIQNNGVTKLDLLNKKAEQYKATNTAKQQDLLNKKAEL